MHAIGVRQFGGGPESLEPMEVDVPEFDANEVLVRMRYASVNPVDARMRKRGHDGLSAFPVVLGRDGAGEVAAIGALVSGFQIGDKVLFFGRQVEFSRGTYAEYAAVPAGWVAHCPERLDERTAAAMPLIALRAYQALRNLALQNGETILMHAAAGGVGSCAVQLASLMGARVIAAVRGSAVLIPPNLGAAVTVDIEHEDFVVESRRVAPEGVDAVVDPLGGETLARSAEAARREGRIVTPLDPPDEKPFASRGVRARRMEVQGSGSDLAQLASLVANGRLAILVGEILALDEAAEAHRKLAEGGLRGKLLLAIGAAR